MKIECDAIDNYFGSDEIIELLDYLKTKEDVITIKGIPAADFCKWFDIQPEDFNGWQCEWWGHMKINGIKYTIQGCAWYSTINIFLTGEIKNEI